MNREKMIKQAKILKDKKLARIATLGKQLRPQVEAGVVKYTSMKEVQKFSAPPAAAKTARTVIPKAKQTQQQQDMTQQNINPKTVVRKQKGCSGCRRNIKKSTT